MGSEFRLMRKTSRAIVSDMARHFNCTRTVMIVPQMYCPPRFIYAYFDTRIIHVVIGLRDKARLKQPEDECPKASENGAKKPKAACYYSKNGFFFTKHMSIWASRPLCHT